MVFDAVGAKDSSLQEKEEDVKGQQGSVERDREVVSFLYPVPADYELTAHAGKMETDYKARSSVDLG